MARKSMKSRVPADVWAAMAGMRQGNESAVYELGSGMQGVVYGIKGNDQWVIKRWWRDGETRQTSWSDVPETLEWHPDWAGHKLAKDIAHGLIQDEHLPNIIYAVGRYIVMERLAEEADGLSVDRTWEAKDLPASALSRKWRKVRRAIRKLELNGYDVNDIGKSNVMLRSDGTVVLSDVVA